MVAFFVLSQLTGKYQQKLIILTIDNASSKNKKDNVGLIPIQ